MQGIMWGMACIVLIYGDIKIPYLKGENYTLPSAYKTVYTSKDRYPSELAIMGIISFCLTLINICCIFITAVVVLKIKEVAAPYTSSPDLRRFWEHDIRVARDTNRATMTHGHDKRSSDKDQAMNELSSVPPDELEYTLEAAIREAVDDDTFRKVNRCSYSTNPADRAFLSFVSLAAIITKMSTPQQKAFCVLKFESCKSVVTVQPRQFNRDPPNVNNIRRWHNHLATGITYLYKLQQWLFPQLQDESNNFIWQQDGVPPHWHHLLRDWLNNVVTDRWIGRYAPDGRAYLRWPPRSPDLTP
ncbi:hypothetical protein ANN_23998 [Periplaneta americana]|uniref:Uncharacterized protein n=1 Tax=Periplaneta americana TaxID=6978 RepID=A0ABQ8S2B7_PERAM|nr:hypothetical protein ANN_23998 [Periplaneta americana]